MPTSIAQFRTARASAGAAYAAAAQAYVDAWVELHAYDNIVRSQNLGGSAAQGDTFNAQPAVLHHANYLPASARDAMVSLNVLSPAVSARTEQLAATWSGS